MKYATASKDMQSTMSDIFATGNMQYHNPLAAQMGRNAPNVPQNALPTGPVDPAMGPFRPIQNVFNGNQTNMATPSQPSNAIALPDMPMGQQHNTSVGLPFGLLQNATFSGNPTININYNCLSQSQTKTNHGPPFKRIRRNCIESDSDSE